MNVVELVVVVLTALLELSVAIVISAGLNTTCNAFEENAVREKKSEYYE